MKSSYRQPEVSTAEVWSIQTNASVVTNFNPDRFL
jgi:hypothetical protein